MSMFLSKKWRLTLAKQAAAEAIRRQIAEAKAAKAEELRKQQEERKAAFQHFQDLEDELCKEMERQQRHHSTVERKRSHRFLQPRRAGNSLDCKECYSASPMLPRECTTGRTPPPAGSSQELQYPRNIDSVTTKGEKSVEIEERSAITPLGNVRRPLLRLKKQRGNSECDRLPPPAIPYPTSSGELLSVHILQPRTRLVKRSLDLRCLTEETPTHKSQYPASTRRLCRLRPSPEPIDTGLDPRFHVFRDVPLNEVKIDTERRAVAQTRMKEYARLARKDHPPVLDERKRMELDLLRERSEESKLRKKYQRVPLHTLGKPTALKPLSAIDIHCERLETWCRIGRCGEIYKVWRDGADREWADFDYTQ